MQCPKSSNHPTKINYAAILFFFKITDHYVVGGLDPWLNAIDFIVERY